MFRIRTIRPGSIRITYLRDDAQLVTLVTRRYRGDDLDSARIFLDVAKPGDGIELKDNFGRKSELERVS
jgi:hypothetical protein